ncbi:hypothetical protein [Actinoplanes regularis]|uniref:Uncharacterized protein n=1 Tax=Actinoplanes regularis TaxID=52697 RepID=A0A238WNQ4_9ACTN|nr:hypothetical protein [Actinoplanes regularis]GIE84688.1 hypothetical protein Are01nite_11680 [Actinoplanes regularis]GLW32309.1 hypothetical protein Areg01_52480 [Actinoplanes regularis]SNR48097.1 hypothetical protein SAMN06264365_102733 [Actinoplanes regularis]
MTDTALRDSPITLDRRLLLGETDYQVTVFPTEDQRLDLCIVSSDRDGRVISEISGSLAPGDLAGLTEVLASTLAGLIAMTGIPGPGSARAPAQRGRAPNRGARWELADDERLRERYHEGAGQAELAAELGRTTGGVRARLEHLGEIPPGGRWRPSRTDPPEHA